MYFRSGVHVNGIPSPPSCLVFSSLATSPFFFFGFVSSHEVRIYYFRFGLTYVYSVYKFPTLIIGCFLHSRNLPFCSRLSRGRLHFIPHPYSHPYQASKARDGHGYIIGNLYIYKNHLEPARSPPHGWDGDGMGDLNPGVSLFSRVFIPW